MQLESLSQFLSAFKASTICATSANWEKRCKCSTYIPLWDKLIKVGKGSPLKWGLRRVPGLKHKLQPTDCLIYKNHHVFLVITCSSSNSFAAETVEFFRMSFVHLLHKEPKVNTVFLLLREKHYYAKYILDLKKLKSSMSYLKKRVLISIFLLL